MAMESGAESARAHGNRASSAVVSPPEPGLAIDELLKLLPQLVVAVRDTASHSDARAGMNGVVLTSRQMVAVIQLSQAGRQTMSAFAAGLGIGRAAASELIERLVEKGLVMRRRDESDRRLILIELRPEAARHAGEVTGRTRDDLMWALRRHPGLSPDELAAFLGDFVARLASQSAETAGEGQR